jgi:hypothetical protein
MIIVSNKYKQIETSGIFVNIMRPSILGNPFRITKKIDREEVIKKYKTRFFRKINLKDKNFIRELERLENIARDGTLILVCCCAPKKCHGDVIKDYLEGGGFYNGSKEILN